MSFRLKTVLGIACIEALLLTILVISGLNYLSSSNAAQLERRAATTAKLVATMTGDAVIAVDLATLDVLVDQALSNPDLVYLRIRSSNGTVLSEGGETEALEAPFVEDQTVEQARADQRLDVVASITVAGSDFGHVELGLSTRTLDRTFGDALIWMVGIALAEMILVALLGLALGHYLTRQLTMLNLGAKQVASGDFGYQIPIEGRDELAETADSFNSMSVALARYAEMTEDARRKAEQGRELAESTLKDALDSMRDHVLVIGDDGKILLANRSYRALYCGGDYPSSADDAFTAEAARSGGETDAYVDIRNRKLSAPLADPRWEVQLSDGRHLLITQQPMSTGGVVVVQTDVSDLYQALDANRQLQRELIQQKKSEAIGTLAGGLAHEINTPVQVIADNATFLAEAIGEIVQMVDRLAEGDIDRADLVHRLETIDWAFVKNEIPRALDDMADGTGRVRDLIQTFKQLANPGGAAIGLVDLSDVVISAIDDVRGSWTSIAAIQTDIPDDMPLVPCQIDQIGQVLRHLIVNAAHAIEARGPGEPGVISIRLGHDQERARIEVEDNGCGIKDDHIDDIYDALFTTKEPGRGSGQGLALAHIYITRGHGGHIRVHSAVGEGTRFTIDLPFAKGRTRDIGDDGLQSLSAGEKARVVA